MRRLRRFAVPLIALFYAATGYPFTVQHYPPPGERIRVSGHFMHLHCDGKGAPVVVMDAGLGGTSLDWSRVQPNLSNYSGSWMMSIVTLFCFGLAKKSFSCC